MPCKIKRLKIEVAGKVQGVGFRPYVYHIAKQLELIGFVFNHSSGVSIEIQGERCDEFVEKLTAQLPPLAKITSVKTEKIPIKTEEKSFNITESQKAHKTNTKISPDVCICKDCLAELFDPQSRFYLYPFLNCTNCGPRFTIVKDLPYDRAKTTMSDFPLCDNCKKDYLNPENRRYHAQPTACEKCGPELSMSIKKIVKHIINGKIIALKSLGGYQLICDAKNEKTVAKLRKRKLRDAKPFACMVSNINSLKQFVKCSPEEETLLTTWPRPIVLLPKLAGDILAPSIACKLSTLGLMLPYTPLHYLLFHGLCGYPKNTNWLTEANDIVLVVTSANISHEPLIMDDQNALDELKDIADEIISYNRKIHTRIDDSVLTVVNKAPFFIRRARSYVPDSIQLAKKIPQGIALGGYLKNTFCIVKDDEAFVSQYIGDLDNAKTIEFFHESLENMLKYLDVKPKYVACDLHPDFYTTNLATKYGVPVFQVQHHHAHLASVAAEHQVQEPSLGLALDGYGYGENGGLWGAELMLLDKFNYKRLGHLKELPLPGGDMASKEPWRMAASVLHVLGKNEKFNQSFSKIKQRNLIKQMLEKSINSPLTSSMGRLFDAASALLGVNLYSDYEGQAAMELESLVTKIEVLQNGWKIENNHLNLLPLMEHLLNCDKIIGANLFHGTLVASLADWIQQTSQKTNIKTVLLSGGCFLNKVLTENLTNKLISFGIKPFIPRYLPPNDGGICLGQIWIAGNVFTKERLGVVIS